MKLTVKVITPDKEVVVHSMEDLYNEIKQYDPSIPVSIEFTETGRMFEATVTATVDP